MWRRAVTALGAQRTGTAAPLWLSRRLASSEAGSTELRVGDLLEIKNRLHRITAIRRVVSGRTPAFILAEWRVIEPGGGLGEVTSRRLADGETFTRVSMDRQNAVLSYFDQDRRVAVLVDESSYAEIEVPVTLFPQGAQNALQPGAPVSVFSHNGVAAWVGLSADAQKACSAAAAE